MRRSWLAGIVVPVIAGFGLSGCATSQKKLISTPTPLVETEESAEDGRHLFSWRWWSKPKTDPLLAQHAGQAESAPSLDSAAPNVDPWQDPKSDRLSRYFPSLGRRTATHPQMTEPDIHSPTAQLGGGPLDAGVRRANAPADATELARPLGGRRPADVPPLLPAPIQIPATREHHRPAPAAESGVDLGVSGANDTIAHSSRGNRPAQDSHSEGTPEPSSDDPKLDGAEHRPAPLPSGSSTGSDPIKAAGAGATLPTPAMPNPSLPMAGAEVPAIVPANVSADWPTSNVDVRGPEASMPPTGGVSDAKKVPETAPNDEPRTPSDPKVAAVVEKPKDPSTPNSMKSEATVSSAVPTLATIGREDNSPTAPAPASLKNPEVLKVAQVDSLAPQPPTPAAVLPSQPEKPAMLPGKLESPPTWTPTSQFVANADLSSGQTQSYFGGYQYASPQGAPQGVSEGHTWGLGLFSGKLLPCLKKKFHKEAPAVYASAQASPQSLFPPTYYACEQKAPAPPTKVLPAPQSALPSPQSAVHVAKKKCEWLENCKLIRAVKDWKAQCKIKMCPCCSGGHNSAKCIAATGLASPQAALPVSSPQTYADVADPAAARSTRPESRDLSKRRDVVQRVSADGIGESPER